MGTWGPKLYDDDLAQDIKLSYEELKKEGKTNQEVLNDIYIIYQQEIEDNDEKSVFWMVLADVLYEDDALTDFIKENALREIKLGKNLKMWKLEASEKDYIERKKEIEKLRKRLVKYKEGDKIKKEENIQEDVKNNEWNIGDTYAYKIKNEKYKDRYLILRKVSNCEYGSIKRYQSAIIYVQITQDEKLPRCSDEINRQEYIIISNEGNVRHQYRMKISALPRKKTEQLTYIGNFKDVKAPQDEYIEDMESNIWGHTFKDIEFLLDKMERLGTNKMPIYYETDPKNISDSHIRFLMRVKYYKEVLEIEPPKDAIVKDDPLLFIALVDSFMIGGFVKNPVGSVNEDVKKETYKRISMLKDIIKNSNRDNKERKIDILNDLEKRVINYNENC